MAISTEERRIVTVLFADMAGSTALGEELDPEEVRRLSLRRFALWKQWWGPRWTRTTYLRGNFP
jgi:class 3 adenylate cyclase